MIMNQYVIIVEQLNLLMNVFYLETIFPKENEKKTIKLNENFEYFTVFRKGCNCSVNSGIC